MGSFKTYSDGKWSKTIQGTITKGGVGVVQAWIYDKLESANGRTQAKADIEAALANVEVEVFRLESEYSFVTAQADYVNSRIEENQGELATVLKEQARDEADFQFRIENKYQLMLFNFKAMTRMQNQQSRFFEEMIPNNSLLGAIYDQNI